MYIGVIGTGAVGYPLYKALQYYHNNSVYAYDTHYGKRRDSWEDILKTEVVFLCLPTNKKKNGRLDNSIVDSVLLHLFEDKYDGVVAIKSTLGLGYIRGAIDRYNLKIVVFPEWLREKIAFQDTVAPEMTVIGSDKKVYVNKILKACPWHRYDKKDKVLNIVTPEEAVMIKLTANALASTKISFANQIQLVCEEYDIDYERVMGIIRTDPRCAPRYLEPGWAYSGYCLPKDTSELSHSVDENNELLKAVEKINRIMEKKDEDK